jgi:hypothetical protein
MVLLQQEKELISHKLKFYINQHDKTKGKCY